MKKSRHLERYRWIMSFFILMLFLSGVTAIPIDMELTLLLRYIPENSSLYLWIDKVLKAYLEVKAKYPFLLYGYDWLAFAHFILAILFIGPYREPVKNIWVVQVGLIACLLVLPLAFIAGYFRGIPFGWQLIDCSFGVLGALPLYACYRLTKKMESENQIK
ncbi:MAG: hypothetical protein H0U44_05205 [Flavisolibacter sp.]|nr:hypothetical protein [Flavisolibacter sp.]